MERLVVDLFMHNVEKWLNIKVFENMLGHFVALCKKGLSLDKVLKNFSQIGVGVNNLRKWFQE